MTPQAISIQRRDTEIKRETETETETTATSETETEMTTTTETTGTTERPTEYCSVQEREREQAHEYETPGVVFYLLSVQFISVNESVISIINMSYTYGYEYKSK